MGIFKDMLGADESIFKNELALDANFIPKLIPYREMQQKHIAGCIKPLFNHANGRNLFIYGAPGIGKTVACLHIFKELEETTDDVVPIYINCWQKNTAYKILVEMCDILGYKFTQNKNTEELFDIVKGILNKKAAVFCFDEIDKLEDFDFIYTILNDILKRSVLLITNYKEWINQLEDRIKSRLLADILEFKPYNKEEMKGILKQRTDYAFVPGVLNDEAFGAVVEKAFEMNDVRAGIHLLRESGLAAEEQSSRKITLEHAQKAISKISEFSIKQSSDLEDDAKLVLDVVKENSGQKIGDLYKSYQQKGGEGTYKTFQRRIEKLEKGKFITTSKIIGGAEGTTTIVNYEKAKKLTEF